MKLPNTPFNIALLHIDPSMVRGVKEVKSLDIFDTSGEFHPEGLFSDDIFGSMGDRVRKLRFGLINTEIEIYHPIIYRSLVDLKRAYRDILAGKRYVLWNEKLRDFEDSDAFDGHTGFHYFATYWDQIDFKRTRSYRRGQKIDLIERYKSSALTSKFVVLPAGLRDVEIGPDGRAQFDEINTLYQRMIAISNTVPKAAVRNNPEILDGARIRLQLTFNELFAYLQSLVEGKKKLMQSSYASRRVQDSTRNVISSLVTNNAVLGSAGNVKLTDTVMGIHQTMVNLRPVTINRILHGICADVFIGNDIPARLVDKRTLQVVDHVVEPATFDKWRTVEGLNKLISEFANQDLRHRPVEIEGHYLALVYRHQGQFRVFNDIRDLPPGFAKSHVKPITYAEFFYHAIYPVANSYPVLTTRYPVAGMGSIYPSFIYLKSTIVSERLVELGPDWHPMDPEGGTAYEFPIQGEAFYDTTSPHSARLDGATADFDGDMMSVIALMTTESVKEIGAYMNSRRAYIGTDGRFRLSANVEPIRLAIRNLTA